MNDIEGHIACLVRAVEAADADSKPLPKIVLSVLSSGIIIDGRIISRRQFREGSHKLIQKITEYHDAAAHQIAAQADAPLDFSDPEIKHPTHIHLADVKFWHPSVGMNDALSETGCWRIRLTSIDGFSLHESPEFNA